MRHERISIRKIKTNIFETLLHRNCTVVPESEEKPQTEQQVHHHLDVHLYCGVCVAYK